MPSLSISLDQYLAFVKTDDLLDSGTGLPRYQKVWEVLGFDEERAAEFIVTMSKLSKDRNRSNAGYLSTLGFLAKLGVLDKRVYHALREIVEVPENQNMLSISSAIRERLGSHRWTLGNNVGSSTFAGMAAVYNSFGLTNKSLQTLDDGKISPDVFWQAAAAACIRHDKPKKLLQQLGPDFVNASPRARIALAKFLINPGCLDRPLVYRHLQVRSKDLR